MQGFGERALSQSAATQQHRGYQLGIVGFQEPAFDHGRVARPAWRL